MDIVTNLLALNPDIDKLTLIRNNVQREFVVEDTSFVDLKESYFFSQNNLDKAAQIKGYLKELYDAQNTEYKISAEVFSHSYSFVEVLYPSLAEELDFDNIYPTPYGTIVFDWELDKNNIFSLEIGSEHIGYFIEKDGHDIKQVESTTLEESGNEIVKELSGFLA